MKPSNFRFFEGSARLAFLTQVISSSIISSLDFGGISAEFREFWWKFCNFGEILYALLLAAMHAPRKNLNFLKAANYAPRKKGNSEMLADISENLATFQPKFCLAAETCNVIVKD